MNDLKYNKIDRNEEEQVFNLIDTVLASLDRKEFFIPYSVDERKRFFDKDFVFTNGAYDNNKLVEICQLFITEEAIKDYYDVLNIDGTKNIITDKHINLMKKNASIINILNEELFNHCLVLEKVKNNELYGYAFENNDDDMKKYEVMFLLLQLMLGTQRRH